MKADTLLPILVSFLACACAHREVASAPQPAPAREPAARVPSIKHLEQRSRVPIIERDARLIAAYVEPTEDKPANFVVFSHTGQFVHSDYAAERAARHQLDDRVDAFLALGHWTAMVPASVEFVDGIRMWNLGGGLHLHFILDSGAFRDDEGRVVGLAPEGVHGLYWGCDRSTMPITAVAYDPVTKLVWMAFTDADGRRTTCGEMYYYTAFYYMNPCSYDGRLPQCKQPATPGGSGR